MDFLAYAAGAAFDPLVLAIMALFALNGRWWVTALGAALVAAISLWGFQRAADLSLEGEVAAFAGPFAAGLVMQWLVRSWREWRTRRQRT